MRRRARGSRHRRDLHRPRRRPTDRSARSRRRPMTLVGRSPPPSASVAGAGRPARLAHGTTVATNALLERQGAVVALVTTAGHEDVLEIARQDRPSLYDPFVDRPEPHRRPPPSLRRRAGGWPPTVPSSSRVDTASIADHPRRRAAPSPCACSTPTSTIATSRAVAAAPPRPGLRRVVLRRGLTRVPRVRARRDDGDQRLPPPGVPYVPALDRRAGVRGARALVGGRSAAGRRRRRPARGPAPVRSGGRRAGRRPPSPPPTASTSA